MYDCGYAQLFAVQAKGVKNVEERKALLLHTAGLSAQDIFFTLYKGEGKDIYHKAKDALNKYFKP